MPAFFCTRWPKFEAFRAAAEHLLVGADAPKLGTTTAIALLELTEEIIA
jgi:hypothetical protein